MVTQDRLKELLYYHPESGDFVWLDDRGRGLAGYQAGSSDKDGYICIKVDDRLYKAHRLAFRYMTGKWPPRGADHKDTIKHHNWWGNLRPANHSQNGFNRGAPANSATGIKNIYWHKQTQRYRVAFVVEGKKRNFGNHKTLDAAIEVCAQAILAFQDPAFARAA